MYLKEANIKLQPIPRLYQFFHFHKWFLLSGTPVEERVTKPSRPIIKSLHVENNLVETNLERSQSLNQVNTNRWGDRYSFQRNNKEQYEEPVEHSRTPEKFIGSKSSETSNQNLPSENLEQTTTNDLYMNYDYQEVTPVTEYKIHGSNNKNPLTFLTSSLEERNKNVENGEDNFERQMPPLIFSEQNEENTPSRKFKIKDTEDQFRVHFVQIDSNHEYPVSEEELFEDEEDISEYKAMGYSSQAASIFFGEYEAPKVNRPRRIVFSSNGEGPAENDCWLIQL